MVHGSWATFLVLKSILPLGLVGAAVVPVIVEVVVVVPTAMVVAIPQDIQMLPLLSTSF
jgi:hypothetical protein